LTVGVSVRHAKLTRSRTRGYTFGMKIAVSIPDDIFAEAESLAQRLKTSRSELYSRALTEFVGHHAPERVTEQMNKVVSDIDEGKPDAFRAEAARRVFKRAEW
jgi:predicted transcriptional regulator